MLNEIIHGDCLEVMKEIPDKSVDMILCDLPYGVTKNKWDSVIPLNELWVQYERVIKDDGAIALFGQGMFSAKLQVSNEKLHRYNLIWKKSRPTGFLNANRMPLRNHEDVCIFYKKLPTYNPQYFEGKPNHVKDGVLSVDRRNNNYGKYNPVIQRSTTQKHPLSVMEFDSQNPKDLLHPTQKPVKLIEWLVKSFTNEGETVLDNASGSSTTAIACINTNRNFICIEKEKEYVDISNRRVSDLLCSNN